MIDRGFIKIEIQGGIGRKNKYRIIDLWMTYPDKVEQNGKAHLPDSRLKGYYVSRGSITKHTRFKKTPQK